MVARALERRRERAASAPAASGEFLPGPHNRSPRDLADLSYREALAAACDRGSRDYLTALLTAFNGNVSRVAANAGLEGESLHRLLRRHRIRADGFREGGGGV